MNKLIQYIKTKFNPFHFEYTPNELMITTYSIGLCVIILFLQGNI